MESEEERGCVGGNVVSPHELAASVDALAERGDETICEVATERFLESGERGGSHGRRVLAQRLDIGE